MSDTRMEILQTLASIALRAAKEPLATSNFVLRLGAEPGKGCGIGMFSCAFWAELNEGKAGFDIGLALGADHGMPKPLLALVLDSALKQCIEQLTVEEREAHFSATSTYGTDNRPH